MCVPMHGKLHNGNLLGMAEVLFTLQLVFSGDDGCSDARFGALTARLFVRSVSSRLVISLRLSFNLGLKDYKDEERNS